MTGEEFFNCVAKANPNILQQFLGILTETGARYCVIGGLAVNAYAEPVVSLDVDIIIAVDDLDAVMNAAEQQQLKAERYEHSINLGRPGSDLRIQIQTDPRYQNFIPGSEVRKILGYPMRVAALEDVLQGKVWACMDESRRKSKRQKDLADILRMVEGFPKLANNLPRKLKEKLELFQE